MSEQKRLDRPSEKGIEEGLINALSEFVGWDTTLIVKEKLMPVIREFCLQLPKLDRPELREKIARTVGEKYHGFITVKGRHVAYADYIVADQILALIPDNVADGYFRGRQDGLVILEANVEEAIVQARKEQMVIDWAQAGKDVEKAKKRERIADNLGEDIYNKIRHLQTRIEEHSWSRQQTNYDGEFISQIDKALLNIGNDLYSFRQALKGEK